MRKNRGEEHVEGRRKKERPYQATDLQKRLAGRRAHTRARHR